MAETTIRKAVPMTSEDLAAVDQIRAQGSVEHQLLKLLKGEGAVRSEASALQALVRLGLDVLHARSLDIGYAELAAHRDAEDIAFAQAVRHRRTVAR